MSLHSHDSHASGPLSWEEIKARYQPPERFRVSRYSYPAGTTFCGSMRPGTLFVLRGGCVYRFGDNDINACAGDVVNLPGGSYDFRVSGGDGGVELVLVWDLSESESLTTCNDCPA